MLYTDVVEYIEKRIEKEQLKSGCKLPPIRSISNELKCSKETVLHAYHSLEEKHRIYMLPRSGYYLLEEKREEKTEKELLDFKTVNPDERMIPYREFQHCVNQAVENYRKELFMYGETGGIASLKEVLKKHLEGKQIFTNPEQIFVTSGAQQALYILFQMKYPNKRKKILIEQPTYGIVNRMMEAGENQLVFISRTSQGINMDELESIFQTNEISFFYCIPRNHNPIGTNLTNEQKRGIVNLANKYNVYVIEDDYLADMNGEKNDLPMHYYDTEGKVIYVKSFAKAFLPGIRLGIAVLPKDCCESFYLVKRDMDLNTSQLDQAALEVFIKSGMYEKHIQKMRNIYSKKVTYLKQFLHSVEKPDIQVIVDESGYFIWIGLSGLIAEEKLIERIKKKGILVTEGKSFYYMKKTEENGIRLCIAKYEIEAVCRGLQSIFNEIGI